MQITVLMENTATSAALYAEHGLSLWIEAGGQKILFDMGQTDRLLDNARRLSVDLSSADLAVLSHGHYDHGGGLPVFLEQNHTASVYLLRSAFEPHFNATGKDIGLLPALEGHPQLVYTKGVTRIGEGLTLYPALPGEARYDLGSFGLTMRQGEQLVPDDFRHEQYLLIEENGLRVLCSGCSHRGILDIAALFQPDVLIGGFHFSKLPLDDTLTGYARQLDQYPTAFYTCHCTGEAQYAWMQPHMSRLHALSGGQRIVL